MALQRIAWIAWCFFSTTFHTVQWLYSSVKSNKRKMTGSESEELKNCDELSAALGPGPVLREAAYCAEHGCSVGLVKVFEGGCEGTKCSG